MGGGKTEKAKKGADWNFRLVILEISGDGPVGLELDPLMFSSIDSMARHPNFQERWRDMKMVEIYYYRSDMPKERVSLELLSLGAGLSGVAIAIASAVLWHYLGAHGAAVASWQKAGLTTGMVVGGSLELGGVTARLTANNIMFHGYLVIECTGGNWISLEKQNDSVVVRMGKHKSQVYYYKNESGEADSGNCPLGHVLQFGYRSLDWNCHSCGIRSENGEDRYQCESCDYYLCDACYRLKRKVPQARDNPTFISRQNAKSDKSIDDLFRWILAERVERKYNILTSNCKHLCFGTVDKFGSEPGQLPDWIMLSAPSMFKQKQN